jgi:hypothetical protein
LIAAIDRASVALSIFDESTPMSTPELQRQIGALSSSLAQIASVDKPTRELLLGLEHQIARLIDTHEGSVTERLERLAVRFEADHPAAGTALRQAIDALAKAGI